MINFLIKCQKNRLSIMNFVACFLIPPPFGGLSFFYIEYEYVRPSIEFLHLDWQNPQRKLTLALAVLLSLTCHDAT